MILLIPPRGNHIKIILLGSQAQRWTVSKQRIVIHNKNKGPDPQP